MRKRYSNGQLRPLRQRLTEKRMNYRTERQEYRSNLARAIGGIQLGMRSFFGRGIFGRLKWLVTGR